jgi:two-component system response regulator HydG
MPSRALDNLRIHMATDGPFAEALRKLKRYALNDHPVVLLGPTGTGKSTLARFVHEHSSRARRPFELVNLGGLDDALASSALFGHEVGAFTGASSRHPGAFQSADGGTLFCDEFAKASPAVQRKLLDVLDTGVVRPLGGVRDIPVNVRLIFAANEALAELVASKLLLHDFLPRIGLMHVRLPRLNERAHEIPDLLRFFIQRHGAKMGYTHSLPHATVELESILQRHDWPENVRELENLTIRLLADADGALELSSALLVDEIAYYDSRRASSRHPAQNTDLIAEALARAKGEKAQAARDLGIGRSTLYRKLEANRSIPAGDRDPPRAEPSR